METQERKNCRGHIDHFQNQLVIWMFWWCFPGYSAERAHWTHSINFCLNGMIWAIWASDDLKKKKMKKCSCLGKKIKNLSINEINDDKELQSIISRIFNRINKTLNIILNVTMIHAFFFLSVIVSSLKIDFTFEIRSCDCFGASALWIGFCCMQLETKTKRSNWIWRWKVMHMWIRMVFGRMVIEYSVWGLLQYAGVSNTSDAFQTEIHKIQILTMPPIYRMTFNFSAVAFDIFFLFLNSIQFLHSM